MPPRKVPASTTPTRHSSRAKRAPSHADDNYPSDVEEPVAKRSKVEKTSPKASKKGSTKKASTKSPKSPKKSSKKSPKATKRSISTKKSSKRSSKKAKSEDEDEDEDEDEKPLIELKEKEDEQPKKKKIKKEKKEQEQEQEQEEEQVEEEIINPIPTIKGHGVLLSFGSGDMSQLGLGDAENMRERKKPTLIQHALTSLSIVAVAAGSLHNAALTAEGDVYTWGCNDDSALGHDKDEWLPTKVEFPEKKAKIAAIACGASHTIALSTTGHIYTWGTYRDANGIMGYSDTMDVAKTPVQMEMDQLVVGIACGEHHDLCLTKKGDVYTWGDIGIGQRGSDRNKKGKLIPRRVLFTKVGTYNKPKIVGIFAGGATNFAVDSKGNVWAWGPNNYHQCGVPNKGKSLVITSPTPIPTLSNITHVACHTHHTLFLTNDGKVYSVGRGEYGRLGLGDQKERDTPTHITSLPTDDDIVTSIGVGESHSLAVTQSGKLYTWGYGDLLQLGTGVEEDVDKPTHITGAQLNGRHVLHAVGGSQHSIVLASQPTAKHPETKTSTSTSADTEKSVAPPPVADYVPPPADVQ